MKVMSESVSGLSQSHVRTSCVGTVREESELERKSGVRGQCAGAGMGQRASGRSKPKRAAKCVQGSGCTG